MLKNIGKRILSVILAVCMVSLFVYTGNTEGSIVQAAGETTSPIKLEDSEAENYEKRTFSDFKKDGVALDATGKIFDQTTTSGVPTYQTGVNNMNGVLFQGKFNFPSTGGSARFGVFYIGGTNSKNGIIIMQNATTRKLIVGSRWDADAGATSFADTTLEAENLLDNPNLEVGISVKYVNSTDTTTDLQVGIWLDGILYNSEYLIVSGVKTTYLSQKIHLVESNTSNYVAIQSVGTTVPEPEQDILLAESEENTYEKLTFADFEIADGNIFADKNGTIESYACMKDGDMNEVYFQGKYNFPTYKSDSDRFGIMTIGNGTSDAKKGILVHEYNGVINVGIRFTGASPAAKDIVFDIDDIRLNENLVLGISVKYENMTETTTDLKIGIWVNEVLYQREYLQVKNVPINALSRQIQLYDLNDDPAHVVGVSSVGEFTPVADIMLSDSEENSYEKLTFADFQMVDGDIFITKNGTNVSYACLKTGDMNEVYFQGKYYFPAYKNDNDRFGIIAIGNGTSVDKKGILIHEHQGVIKIGTRFEGIPNQDITLNIDDIRSNENLVLGISVKYENVTETTTDLKIGIWVNEALYKRDYVTVKNVLLSDLNRQIQLYDLNDDATHIVGIASVGDFTSVKFQTLPIDFTNLTLTDGNIPDGNKVTYGGFSRLKSLDKTLLSANVRFNKVGARMHLGTPGGGNDVYSGLGIRLEKNGTLVLGNELASKEGEQPYELATIGLNYYVVSPELAGMGDSFAGKDFLLQISTEFVDQNGNGSRNDIKLGIYINGILYCNSYVFIMNEANTLGTGINFNGVNEEDFARFSSVALTELTTTDLGIENGAYTKTRYGTTSEDSLDQTAITVYVTFSQQAKGAIGFGSKGRGIQFSKVAADILKLSHVKADGTVVDVANLKLQTTNQMELRTTYEFIKSGEDKVNLKLGVFINGQLYNYQYFIVEDVDASVLTRSMEVVPSGSTIKIASDSYEELTLRDFIIKDKKLETYGGKFYSYEGVNYNNTSFSAVLTFSDETKNKNDNCFYVGGKKWAGLRAELGTDGKLAISFVHKDGTQMKLARISPKDVGMITFQGTAFTYRVTFDVFETIKGQFDANVGVYVNGKLCQGKHLFVKDVDADVLERGLFSYIGKNGGSITMKSTRPEVDFTIYGLTKNWKKILGIR